MMIKLMEKDLLKAEVLMQAHNEQLFQIQELHQNLQIILVVKVVLRGEVLNKNYLGWFQIN